MTSGCYIKLDLIEFIQVVDDIDVQMGLQEGTAFIIPLTVRNKNQFSVHRKFVSKRCYTLHFSEFSFAFIAQTQAFLGSKSCVVSLTIKIADITCKYATLRQ